MKYRDVVKMRSTIKQFVRDWSSEGAHEREMCYKPIIEEVCARLPPSNPDQPGGKSSVLHPGAGLGRLAYEFAKRGYKSQGNEFAYFMLLASNHLINGTHRKEMHELHPFIHSFSNVKTEDQPLRAVLVPDENPGKKTALRS